MKYVKAEWSDSNEMWGWHEGCNYSPADCVTVGVLVRDDDISLSVALSTSGERYCSVITIPKGSIKKITYLEEKR